MRKKTVIEIDYNELESIVRKHYGIDHNQYSFVATEECGNDTHHSFNVTGAAPLRDYDQETIDEIKATGNVPEYSNLTIMQDLVNSGVLEPGEYLVDVSW